jgi:hypothetical protein
LCDSARLREPLTDTADQAREDIIRQRQALKDKAGALDARIATGSKRLTLFPDELLPALLDEPKSLRADRQAIDREIDNLRTAEGEGRPDSGKLGEALVLVEKLDEAPRKCLPRSCADPCAPW